MKLLILYQLVIGKLPRDHRCALTETQVERVYSCNALAPLDLLTRDQSHAISNT